MNVVLFGATGMVGAGVLLECLDDAAVASVLVIGRRPCGVSHPKVTEMVREDLFDVEPARAALAGKDACFWCLGVTSVGMTEEQYGRVTRDLTMVWARALLAASPQVAFVFVSGAGSDSSERGRVMWARIKGQAENAVLGLGFRAAYAFRPAFIQPRRGVVSRTRLYNAFYAVFSPFEPLLRRLMPQLVTSTIVLGRAMIGVVRKGYEKHILETRDINRAAEG